MSSKSSSSLKELKNLREAVLAEEKARTQALLQNFTEDDSALPGAEAEAAEIPPEPAEVIEEREPPPGPPPISVRPTPPSGPVRPPAAAPASAASRAKANKEPALIIPLTPRIKERLERNVENSRWSPAQLVMEIVRVTLHTGYPEIQYGDQLIARPGTYRTFERHPLDATLKIISGQGEFQVTVNPECAEYQQWLSYFTGQKNATPERQAEQLCLFHLQSYLESFEDFRAHEWVKSIDPEAYSVTSLV